MALMRRQSLVKFDAPLCETIVDTPKPQGARGAGPHRALRAVPFRPAHPGRLCRSRRRQEARHHARHDAALHARPRDRRRRRGSRPRRAEGSDRHEEGGVPLDRLRPVPRLRQRRRESLRQAALSRRLHRRRLRQPRAGARREIPARLRSAAGQPGRDPDVLRRHRLRRAEAAGRPAAAAQSAADRARRRRHDGPVVRAGHVQAADLGRRSQRRPRAKPR